MRDKELRNKALKRILKRRFNRIISGDILLYTEKSNEEFINNLDKLIDQEIEKMKKQQNNKGQNS